MPERAPPATPSPNLQTSADSNAESRPASSTACGARAAPRAASPRINVLFVCSRNQWRSPTGEQVWRRDARVNARSAGTSQGARHPVSAADIAWADVILAMEDKHRRRLLSEHRELLADKLLHVLDIPDDYGFMDPELVELLAEPVAQLLGLTA